LNILIILRTPKRKKPRVNSSDHKKAKTKNSIIANLNTEEQFKLIASPSRNESSAKANPSQDKKSEHAV
jgi:hypothetical protein